MRGTGVVWSKARAEDSRARLLYRRLLQRTHHGFGVNRRLGGCQFHADAPLSSPLTVMLGRRGSTASASGVVSTGAGAGVRAQAHNSASANHHEYRIACIFLHNGHPDRVAGR